VSLLVVGIVASAFPSLFLFFSVGEFILCLAYLGLLRLGWKVQVYISRDCSHIFEGDRPFMLASNIVSYVSAYEKKKILEASVFKLCLSTKIK
jgi:hypothetical protein